MASVMGSPPARTFSKGNGPIFEFTPGFGESSFVIPANFIHVAGETLFFTCRVANFAKSPDEKIHLTYSVEAFDPQGVALNEIYKHEVSDEVTPQDREWQPKIETEAASHITTNTMKAAS